MLLAYPFLFILKLQLKIKAQGELPSAHLGKAWGCERRNLSGSLGIDVAIRLSQIHIVKRVEQLHSELRVYSFSDPQSLAQRSIGVEKARTIEGVECYVPKGPNRRTLPRAARATVEI